MHQLVSSSGDFAAMHKPELFIFSFRFFPARLRKNQSKEVDQEFDRLNQKMADEIMASGFAFIMTTKVKGHVVLRLSICSHRTTLKDMEEVFARLQKIGNDLSI